MQKQDVRRNEKAVKHRAEERRPEEISPMRWTGYLILGKHLRGVSEKGSAVRCGRRRGVEGRGREQGLRSPKTYKGKVRGCRGRGSRRILVGR